MSDDFSDDGDEAIQIVNVAVNKHASVSRRGQTTLDGSRLEVSSRSGPTVYEEVRETRVSFDPTHHELNRDCLATIIYPANLEVRQYQETIVRHALLENTLVALPTGLGKTLIASAVMLNLYRWCPKGKVLFLAPTRPLVAQQMRACYGIAGLPLDDTAILLDLPKKERAQLWQDRRVFFSTPQVIANDLRSGILDPTTVACIVVDEAHRARGNYAYCTVAQLVYRVNTSFRLLALTATPGADAESIQAIVDSLGISRIEVRTESDPDVARYVNGKAVEKVDCPLTAEIDRCIGFICDAILPILRKANAANIYDITDPSRINQFIALEKSRKVVANRSLPEGLKWTYYYQLKLLAEVGMFLRRLNVYGVTTFYRFFVQKYSEFTTKYELKKSSNRMAASFYFHDSIKRLKTFCERMIESNKLLAAKPNSGVIEGLFSHTKLQELVKRLRHFLEHHPHSSVIVFTEFRESALEIVTCLESANKLTSVSGSSDPDLLRPHIFIGQAKEKDKFDEAAYRKGSKKRKGGDGAAAAGKENQKQPRKKKESTPAPTTRLESSVSAQIHGMTQKVQKELLKKFQGGTYNILVATSIGEEGLDIGEVDMIVCYDSTSSPIKNIQRMGRTGRKREGNVVLLFSGNERNKFERAMDNYKWIQNKVRNDDMGLQLRASDRILPKEIEPELVQQVIHIPEENEQLLQARNAGNDEVFLEMAQNETSVKKKKGKRAKKDTNGGKQQKIQKKFFMPKNVETGFLPASKLVRKVGEGEEDEPEQEVADVGDVSLEQLLSTSGDELEEVVPARPVPKQGTGATSLGKIQKFAFQKGPAPAPVPTPKSNPEKPAPTTVLDLTQFTDDELQDDESSILPKAEQKKEVPLPSSPVRAPASQTHPSVSLSRIPDPLICVRSGDYKSGSIPHSTASKSLIGFYKTVHRGSIEGETVPVEVPSSQPADDEFDDDEMVDDLDYVV